MPKCNFTWSTEDGGAFTLHECSLEKGHPTTQDHRTWSNETHPHEEPKPRVEVARADVDIPHDGMRWTKEALKANDGKKIPLTSEPGGPVIGEATLQYDDATGSMSAELNVTDPKWAELLATSPSPFNVFRRSES